MHCWFKITSIIKIDIEGAEFEGLPVWIADGSLDNVIQVGIEIHVMDFLLEQMRAWANIFHSMHKIGFRIIAQDTNLVWVTYKLLIKKLL